MDGRWVVRPPRTEALRQRLHSRASRTHGSVNRSRETLTGRARATTDGGGVDSRQPERTIRDDDDSASRRDEQEGHRSEEARDEQGERGQPDVVRNRHGRRGRRSRRLVRRSRNGRQGPIAKNGDRTRMLACPDGIRVAACLEPPLQRPFVDEDAVRPHHPRDRRPLRNRQGIRIAHRPHDVQPRGGRGNDDDEHGGNEGLSAPTAGPFGPYVGDGACLRSVHDCIEQARRVRDALPAAGMS